MYLNVIKASHSSVLIQLTSQIVSFLVSPSKLICELYLRKLTAFQLNDCGENKRNDK